MLGNELIYQNPNWMAEAMDRALKNFNDVRDKQEEKKLKAKTLKMEMAKAGLIETPEEEFTKSPEALEQQKKETEIKAAEHGLKEKTDEFGDHQGYEVDPEYWKAKGNSPMEQTLKTLQIQNEQAQLNKHHEEAKGKPEQFQAAGYARRMEQAENNMSDLMGAGYDPTTVGQGLLSSSFVPESLKPSDLKQYQQLKNNFVSANLRKESGAAIAKDERDQEEKKYFPQPGDSPEVLEQKRQSRAIALQTMKQSSGPAYEGVNQGLLASKSMEPRSNGGLVHPKMGLLQGLMGDGAKSNAATDPKIDAYAKQHGLSYESAQQLLRNRGYGVSSK